ncbi:hypothetical protein [Chenggangzhangella methanolivorans]|nr:hypothetical protein [Chenggangzhangella methanolivorans]
MAEIRNDIEALDRTLGSFGYIGDLDAAMPRQKRQVMFGTGELTRTLMREVADADGPMMSRELAQTVISLRADDARDRKLLSEVTRWASKALRKQRDEGRVQSAPDQNGNLLWVRRNSNPAIPPKRLGSNYF